MRYSRNWGSVLSPGCLVFLIDCSAQMSKRQHEAADLVNKAITSLLNRCIKGDRVVPRFFVAAICYASSVESLFGSSYGSDLVPIDRLAENPLRVETRRKKEVTEMGEIIEYDTEDGIWMEPKAQGEASLCMALARAEVIAHTWVQSHQHCFPPIIVNVTVGGKPADGDPRQSARQLCELATDDGRLLLWTWLLTNDFQQTSFPAKVEEIGTEADGSFVFDITSPVPKGFRPWLFDDSQDNQFVFVNPDPEEVFRVLTDPPPMNDLPTM